MPDEVVLKIGGREWRGWEEVRITRSMEDMSGSFELRLSDRWRDDMPPRLFRPGEACQVRLGRDTVITGYVDSVAPEYDATTHAVTVTGRDRTADLIDCSLPAKQYRKQTLQALAEALCKPFGISVIMQAQADGELPDLEAEAGMTVHEVLDRAAAHKAVMLMSDGKGSLLITEASTQQIGVLKLGDNIKQASATIAMGERFSEYRVIGQTKGADNWPADQAAGPSATAKDKQIKRYRPTTIIADAGESDLQRRADHERSVRAGRAARATYTVPGWRTPDGALWQPNRLVRVTDAYLGIDTRLIIAAVAYIETADGRVSEITVTRPEAFQRIPLPAPDAGGL